MPMHATINCHGPGLNNSLRILHEQRDDKSRIFAYDGTFEMLRNITWIFGSGRVCIY